MAKTILRLTQGEVARKVSFDQRRLVLGASSDCTPRLAMPGIAPAHLEIWSDAGLTRVRSLTGGVCGTVGGRPVGREWEVVGHEQLVCLPVRGEPPVCIDISTASVITGGTLVESEPAGESRPTQPQYATPDAVEPTVSLFGSTRPTVATAAPKRRRRWTAESGTFLCATLLLIVVVVGVTVIGVKQALKSRRAAEVATRLVALDETIKRANGEITRKEYVAAKETLDAARREAEAVGRANEYAARIESIARRPEIRFGANGYALLDGTWQPAAVVATEQGLRERQQPQLVALKGKAEGALAAADYENGRRYCDDALELLSRRPIQPAPQADEFAKLRNRIRNKSVEQDMLAKGMVLAGDQWVTPDEQFRLNQIAAGLVEYRGKWLPQAEAFAAAQRDKGLVLLNGRWLTPDEARVAQGYIRFEDKWVLAAERDRIVRERAEASQRADAARQAERERLEQLVRGGRQPQQGLNVARATAYKMSQEFVKDELKTPGLKFPPLSAKSVTVGASDGWFLVGAYVDIPDIAGNKVRKNYLCKLRQKPGVQGEWESESTFILGN